MQYFSPEDAISWVDQNAKQIIGHSRKYLPFAPYDQDDFLQDAYEAALEAAEVSVDRQIHFPACFWVLFKGKVSAVIPNPNSKRNAGSCSPPRTICDFSDFTTERLDPSDIFGPDESVSTIDVDQVYPLVREHFTSVETLTLEAVIGIHDGPMKIKEAARHLGCSPSNIRQTLSRAYGRISGLVANGAVNIQFIDGEIVQLSHPEEVIALEQLEFAVEVQAPEVTNKAETKRSEDLLDETSSKIQPRHHHVPWDRKAPDAFRTLGTNMFQSVYRSSRFGNPEILMAWNNPTGSRTERMASWRYDYRIADIASFATGNNIAPRIRSVNREYQKHEVIGMIEKKSPQSIVEHINSRKCRNGPIFLFLEKYTDDQSVKQNQMPPAMRQKRRRTIDSACRSGPICFDKNILPASNLIEPTIIRLAA